MSLEQTCRWCQTPFQLTDQDLSFYNKVSPTIGGQAYSIPPPTLCYECRQQRKLCFRNERTFYSRPCGSTGDPIMSIYAPENGTTVYEYEEWYSDKWDAITYGREFDFSRLFFPQFFELHNQVPLMSLDVKADTENCAFTNLITKSRDCYFAFACTLGEDCMYSNYLQRNKDVVDCFFIFDSECCYECIDAYNCYNLLHSQYCHGCNDSHYLYNCQSCSNCFGCVSLVGKQFHIFNEPVPEKVYQQQISKILENPELLKEALEKITALKRNCPQKYYAGIQNEGVSGDHISYSKNTHHSFDCTYLEDCKNCTWMHKSTDCFDCYGWGLGGELGYESHLIGNTFSRVLFSESCWEGVSDLLYSRYCVNNCRNLFGCVSLRQKEYCILNKQYSKEDYETLVPQIIEHMRETGEWGEFFPPEFSPFGYNETVAQEYFPLSKDEVQKREWNWKDRLPFTTGQETILLSEIPSDISQVPESITKEILSCTTCTRNYRIISHELRFYKKMNLSLPTQCFDCRYRARRNKRNSRHLHSRFCEKCGENIQTTFSPKDPDLVYCEPCYLSAVHS